jgi:universal stress protein A
MVPRRILFCTDFSENSEPARRLAVQYAKAFGARLEILHILTPGPDPWAYPLEDQCPYELSYRAFEEKAGKAIQAVAESCRRTVLNVTTTIIPGNPKADIALYAADNQVDLIVIGTHGFSGLSHLVMGSVAENVLRSATRPVLVARASTVERGPAKVSYLHLVP